MHQHRGSSTSHHASPVITTALFTLAVTPTAQPPPKIHRCQVLPVKVVQPISIPNLDNRTPELLAKRFDGGACSYRILQAHTPGAAPQLLALVDTTYFTHADNAREATDAHRIKLEVREVRGLGDGAFLCRRKARRRA